MSKDAKRGRLYIYGERTAMLSIQVPASKKDEIRGKFYDVLKGYENPTTLTLESDKLPKEIIGIDLPEKQHTEKCFSVTVMALPKDKKQISVGLYSGSGKFYTNKVVSGELKILEWEDIDAAKSYLDNLKK